MAVAGGMALIGAVALLRATVTPVPNPAPADPAPMVAPYTAPGVTVARFTGPPPRPQHPEFVAGQDTPVLAWAPSPGATAYEVGWQAAGHDEQHRMVAQPRIALSGVPARSSVTINVAAVNALGHRSIPLRLASGSLAAPRDLSTVTPFTDPFSSPSAPDRARWRLPEGDESCLARGDGRDRGMLVVGHGCGTMALRPSVPLVLGRPAPDGSRGRVVLVADGPPAGGELVIGLLPAAVAGLPPGSLDTPPPPAGTAAADPTLPSGTVLLRIGSAGPTLTLGADVPATVTPGPAPAPAAPGAPATWELRVNSTGITALRDGAVMLTAAGVPVPWHRATAVLAVRPALPDPLHRTLLDAVRMTTTPPPPSTMRVVALPGLLAAGTAHRLAPADVAGATTAQLLGWLRVPPSARRAPTVSLGTAPPAVLEPATTEPEVAGGTVPVVAKLPLPHLTGPAGQVALRLEGPSGTELTGAVLQIAGRPEVATAAPAPRLPRKAPPRPPVPAAKLALHDAAGATLNPALPLPAGPITIGITLDAGSGQAIAGAAAGYVGVEVELGGRTLLRLPTAQDGPAAGGTYRLSLDPAALPGLRGALPLSVRVVPADMAQPASVSGITVRLP